MAAKGPPPGYDQAVAESSQSGTQPTQQQETTELDLAGRNVECNMIFSSLTEMEAQQGYKVQTDFTKIFLGRLHTVLTVLNCLKLDNEVFICAFKDLMIKFQNLIKIDPKVLYGKLNPYIPMVTSNYHNSYIALMIGANSGESSTFKQSALQAKVASLQGMQSLIGPLISSMEINIANEKDAAKKESLQAVEKKVSQISPASDNMLTS